ncbi:MAG: helix-turn-helix domain-containing protein [Methylocella sp.]
MSRVRTNLQTIIAANVRRRRLELGLSQEQFAEIAGYHRTYIGAVERGERNITVSTLSAIAAALKLDVNELIAPND